MTRIYTNVPSIVAQFNVTQSMSSLQTSLERLSTGFRINSGKDDPAGLIASEVLRSEITGIKQGITNTERANMMIATADSAMNEISNLLNDIRGLVSEAANTGAMSPEMINANQLQVDASLEAIDRISASTTFMGRKLLDGSLDFTTNGVDRSTITGLAINKATFGTSKNPVTVNIQVRQPAERAELYYNHAVAMDDVTLEVSGSKGGSPFQFVKGTTVKEMVDAINLNSDSTGVIAELGQTATKGSMQISSVGDDNDIIVTAGQQGAQAGFVTIKYTKGTEQGVYVDYEESLGTGFPATINVQLQTEAWQSAQALGVDSDTLYNNNALDFTANIPGVHYNGVSINYVDGNMVDAGFQNSAQNPTGTASAPYAYYNDVATQATTLLGDINGLPAFTNGTGPGDYLQVTAVQGGSQYNDVNVQFINAPSLIPVGSKAFAQYIDDLERPGKKVLNVYVDTTNPATFNEIQAAINLNGTFTCTVNGNLGTQTIAAADCHTILAPGIQGNTNYSGGDAGTLFVVINNGVTTANDISAIFDLNSAASRGSARAASMFTVGSSIDNDGTGVVSSMQMKGAFKNGVDGGNVVTTAEEVVAALNNDKLWNQVISRQTLQDLISGKIGPFFANDTPIITAAVAPANSGKGVVSEFQEVAYYGCPYDGTGLQFLGPTGSRDIRFVAEPGNSELAIDFTSVPDRLDYSQAILHGTNPNANVVFTARTKGGENDDITFRIKHAAPYEDPPGSGTFVQHPEGWAELDNGESFAETQLFFYNGTTGAPIQNSAFYLTANERGTAFNNVNVNLSMATPGSQTASVVVAYDAARKALNISLRDANVTTNDVIAAINAQGADGKSLSGFTATLSYTPSNDSASPLYTNNDGTGKLADIGLATTSPINIGNTGDTGGHAGTVTVYLVDKDVNGDGTPDPPNAQQIVDVVNRDDIIGSRFTAQNYTAGSNAGTGAIDFLKDTNFQTDGGIAEKGVIVVHLQTDANGLVQTTARDLVNFWDSLPVNTTDGISVSLLREPGAVWDACNDTDGHGILSPTASDTNCDVTTYFDIAFQGWADDPDYTFDSVAGFASGRMVAINGENASLVLQARKPGIDYNGFELFYVNDMNVTGRFEDNREVNNTLMHDGLAIEINGKEITVHIREGVTTANDIKQLIESDPMTRNLFQVLLTGDGTGLVNTLDDTLVTTGGIAPPGELNGAKLLGGLDADEFGMRFLSSDFGSDAKVEVIATRGTFELKNANGQIAEVDRGQDMDALLNGVQMVARGLNVSINTSTIGLSFTFAEGTQAGYTTSFDITGGGATFQLGPAVTTNQQITIGIQSLNTISLGGVSGKLYELKSGQDADLSTNTAKAYQIVEGAIVQVTSLRGRLGALQRATFETNINVLGDTLVSLTAAESQIRDTDFAEETSNMTRDQILVQSGIRTLGLANQIPQYILGLLQ